MAIAPVATRFLIVIQCPSSLHVWVEDRWPRTCHIAVPCSCAKTAEKFKMSPFPFTRARARARTHAHTHTHTHIHFGNSIIYLKNSSFIFDYNKLPKTVLETSSVCTVKRPACSLFIAEQTFLNFKNFPTLQNGAQVTWRWVFERT